MDNCVKNTALQIALRVGPSRITNGLKEPTEFLEIVNEKSVIVNNRAYTFDHVFKQQITQHQLYETLMRPLVDKVLKGYNCTALAYGQTGTGKSYSMGLNCENLSDGHVGMVPRCLREIFKCIESLSSAETEPNENETIDSLWPSSSNTTSTTLSNKHNVYVSFIEIYNEKVFDLLSNVNDSAIPSRGYKFTGGKRQQIATLEDFHKLFDRGTKSRHVRPTVMNSASSRSHAIFTIHVQSDKFESRLNFVDLAGSEGVRRTGHQGIAMSEGVNINQGLLCLNKVLYSLNVGHKVIPYRDSVLTSVLQDSLNDKSYLTLLACISPDRIDQTQSIATMRFAQSAKQLKHTPQLNSILMERQRNNITQKTPHDSIGFKRPLYCSTTQKPFKSLANVGKHHKTICTPSKRKLSNTQSNKRNYSEVGLTPNAKKKAMTRMRSELPYNLPPRQREFHEESAESLFDFNDARGSLADLNISTSTVLDVPSIGQTTNMGQMPMLQEYLMQFELRMANNMQQMLKTFITSTQTQQLNEPTRVDQTRVTETTMSSIDTIPKADKVDVGDNMALTAGPSNAPNVRCQLFTTSSSPFKVPADCKKPSNKRKSSKHREIVVCESIQSRWLRSSSVISDMSGLSHVTTNETCDLKINADNSNQSLKKMYAARRSIRLAAKRIPCQNNNSNYSSNALVGHTAKAPKPTRNIIAKRKEEQKVTPIDVRLKNHRKEILELFNKGTTRQLQKLPQIGQKTAYQIVVQRTLLGTFKSLAHIEKLPVWRGNAWSRFAEANILI